MERTHSKVRVGELIRIMGEPNIIRAVCPSSPQTLCGIRALCALQISSVPAQQGVLKTPNQYSSNQQILTLSMCSTEIVMSKVQNVCSIQILPPLAKAVRQARQSGPITKAPDTKAPVIDEEHKKGVQKGGHFLCTSLNLRFYLGPRSSVD
jgi:hypothetical protein